MASEGTHAFVPVLELAVHSPERGKHYEIAVQLHCAAELLGVHELLVHLLARPRSHDLDGEGGTRDV